MKILRLILLLILAAFSNIYTQIFWQKANGLDNVLDNVIIYSLAVNSNGYIFAGTDLHGFFRSTNNGATWSNLGLMNLKTTGIVIMPGGEIFISTLDHNLGGGIFHSTDNGNTWSNMGYSGASTAIAINSDGDIFLGALTIGIFRSTDNGSSWVHLDSTQGLSDGHLTSLKINSNNVIFAGTIEEGVFRSTDNGDNWSQINQGFPTDPPNNHYIISLEIGASEDIFAGTSGRGTFRSTNNGDVWVPINTGLTNDYVFAFAINSNGNIFAGADNGVFQSTNNGDNWTQISEGLTNHYVKSLTINSGGVLFVGTEDGIFRSNSTLPVELTSFTAAVNKNRIKLNWQTSTEVNNYGFDIERSENIPDNLEWEKIGFIPGNGNSNSPKDYTYVDVNPVGGSEFLYRLKQIDNDGQFEYSDIVEAELVPTEFALYQNYPNPFNPNTKIRYSLKDNTQFVSLVVYDVLGNEIKTLVNEEKPAGTYELTWSAANLPSGVYFYRLQAGSYTETRKMSLLK